MSTQNDFTRSFQVNTPMSAWRRVQMSSNGFLDLGALGVIGVGILQEDTNANTYENPKVRLYGTGTAQMAVSGAPVAAGNSLYAITGGYVAPTSGGVGGQIVGIALESTLNNGDVIEVLPQF